MTSTTQLLVNELKRGDSPVFDDIAAEMVQGHDIIADRVADDLQHIGGTGCPVEAEAVACGVIAPRRQEILRRLQNPCPSPALPRVPGEGERLGGADDSMVMVVPRSLIERASKQEQNHRDAYNLHLTDEERDAAYREMQEVTRLLKAAVGGNK